MQKKGALLFRNYRIILVILVFFTPFLKAQRFTPVWSKNGNSYYVLTNNEITEYSLPQNTARTIFSAKQFSDPEQTLKVSFFQFSDDQKKILLFTNAVKVWRIQSRGDYWIYDIAADSVFKIGASLPTASLMFAKFSPDGRSVAYVSGNNLYVEDIQSRKIRQLTHDGSETLINGTFDWVYEEEFSCRDGFRWSPDSKSIAFWQIDAAKIGKFLMINNTDSIYSAIIPVEYPKAGQKPSVCRVGVVNVENAQTTWMNIPGEPDNNYILRVEFIPFTKNLLIHQLNREQNHGILYKADAKSGDCKIIYEEQDEAWIDYSYTDQLTSNSYTIDYTNNYVWTNNNESILWISDKSGWNHFYEISLVGKPEKQITSGNYDVIEYMFDDAKGNKVYFIASPENATQRYLYRSEKSGKSNIERVTPTSLNGVNSYSVSPSGKFAFHKFSNHFTKPYSEFITLANHKPVNKSGITDKLDSLRVTPTAEFFTIETEDHVKLDGWMVKPVNFDPTRKYPVVFYVYTEPWGSTVSDEYGISDNFLYMGDMEKDGYIYISVDNRGTPVPKGREWRKSVYKQIGQLNIRDQAMAAKEILKWDFVDSDRVAVWGWSGGGSATLNLMFQYPDIYKTGIAIAAVSNDLTYDNVYQERYMGLPQNNLEDYIKGSPITYASNLKGNLLYIHGTGDDNVHYQNAEMLINALVKYNKQFQIMPYPNRSHGISEGEGTLLHLMTLYTRYLKTYCPPGPK